MTSKTEKRKMNLSITNEKVFNIIKISLSILIALAVTFIVLCIISDDPVNAFVTILTGPLRKPRYMGVAFEKTIPYVFSGLCCCVMFKAGFFNLGAEGIFIMSGIACTATALNQSLAIAGIHPIFCILAAAVSGGLLMMIPTYLKQKFGANEMVLSLMLNSAYLGIGCNIIKKHFLTKTTTLIASHDFLETARIGYLPGEFFSSYHISFCFFLTIAIVLVIYYILNKTKLGYQIRLTGANPDFANYSGINSFKLAMTTAFISGALAGIGAAIQLLTQYKYFSWTQEGPGVGFSGNLMAMLGQNNPIGVLIASFFIQYLEEGTSVLYYTDSSVPSEIVAIVEGVMVLLISSQYFLRKTREKRLLKEGLGIEAKGGNK